MRRAGKWLEEKRWKSMSTLPQMGKRKETPKPYETLLRLVRAGGKRKKEKNFAENLFVAKTFSSKRELLPHQWYLLNGAMVTCSIFSSLLHFYRNRCRHLTQKALPNGGASWMDKLFPTFTSAYVWCKPETPIHKKRVHRKTAYATKRTGELSYVLSHPRAFWRREKRFVPKGKHNILGHVTVPFRLKVFLKGAACFLACPRFCWLCFHACNIGKGSLREHIASDEHYI